MGQGAWELDSQYVKQTWLCRGILWWPDNAFIVCWKQVLEPWVCCWKMEPQLEKKNCYLRIQAEPPVRSAITCQNSRCSSMKWGINTKIKILIMHWSIIWILLINIISWKPGTSYKNQLRQQLRPNMARLQEFLDITSTNVEEPSVSSQNVAKKR